MPIPKPKKNEKEKDFISRFMSNDEMTRDYEDREQRLAVAYSTWRDRDKKDIRGQPIEVKKYESLNFKPTQAMANNAKRALEVRKSKPESQRGMTSVGLARARQLINRETLSPDTVRRMFSFFSRHQVDKKGKTWKDKGKGWQAWMGWGGDAGFTWSRRLAQAMDKEDNKKNNQYLELKQFELKITQIDEKGTFKGIASPFNNIDNGNDRVKPSIALRNNNKIVPYLWQHDQKEPIGSVKLYSTEKGMEFDGKLYLDKLENGNPMLPNAYKAYALMKNGMLKNSIGYKTIKYSHDKQGVRDLEDIDIKEVSAVTIPMNEEAKITSVKAEKEDSKSMSEEVKAMDMAAMMATEDYEDKMGKMMYGFRRSNDNIMMDPNMSMSQKLDMIKKNCMYIMENYPKYAEMYMKMYHGEDGMMRKDLELDLDFKNFDDIEEKAGAKIGKATRAQMMKAYRMVMDGMTMFKGMIGEMDNKPKSDDIDDYEVKTALYDLYRKVKGDE